MPKLFIKIFIVLLATNLIVCGVLPPKNHVSAINKNYNLDFEAVSSITDILGWDKYNTNSNITLSKTQFADGKQSLQLIDNSTLLNAGALSEVMSVLPNKSYEASVKIKNGVGEVYIQFLDNSGNIAHQVYKGTSKSIDKWQTINVVGKAPANAVSLRILLYSSKANKGTLYFDSIKLNPIIENGDFQTVGATSIPGWSKKWGPQGFLKGSSHSQDISPWDYKLNIDDKSSDEPQGLESDLISILANYNYNLYFTNSIPILGNKRFQIYIRFFDSTKKLISSSITDVDDSFSSNRKISFKAPSNAAYISILPYSSKENTVSFKVDNFYLEMDSDYQEIIGSKFIYNQPYFFHTPELHGAKEQLNPGYELVEIIDIRQDGWYLVSTSKFEHPMWIAPKGFKHTTDKYYNLYNGPYLSEIISTLEPQTLTVIPTYNMLGYYVNDKNGNKGYIYPEIEQKTAELGIEYIDLNTIGYKYNNPSLYDIDISIFETPSKYQPGKYQIIDKKENGWIKVIGSDYKLSNSFWTAPKGVNLEINSTSTSYSKPSLAYPSSVSVPPGSYYVLDEYPGGWSKVKLTNSEVWIKTSDQFYIRKTINKFSTPSLNTSNKIGFLRPQNVKVLNENKDGWMQIQEPNGEISWINPFGIPYEITKKSYIYSEPSIRSIALTGIKPQTVNVIEENSQGWKKIKTTASMNGAAWLKPEGEIYNLTKSTKMYEDSTYQSPTLQNIASQNLTLLRDLPNGWKYVRDSKGNEGWINHIGENYSANKEITLYKTTDWLFGEKDGTIKQGEIVKVIGETDDGLTMIQTSKGVRYAAFAGMSLDRILNVRSTNDFVRLWNNPKGDYYEIRLDVDLDKISINISETLLKLENLQVELNNMFEEIKQINIPENLFSSMNIHIEEMNKSLDAMNKTIESLSIEEALLKLHKGIRKANEGLAVANQSISQLNNNLETTNKKINDTNLIVQETNTKLTELIKDVNGKNVNINLEKLLIQKSVGNYLTAEVHLDFSTLPFQMAGETYTKMNEDFLGLFLTTAPVSGDIIALGEILSGKATDGTTLTSTDYALYSMSLMFGSLGRTGKNIYKGSTGLVNNIRPPKFTSKEIELDWFNKLGLSKQYNVNEVTGTVRVQGKVVDISRRVYRLKEIDWNYISNNPSNKSKLTNLELAASGKSPYYKDDSRIVLHHVTQDEPGSMLEIPDSKHVELTNIIHGSIVDGDSFRNDYFKYTQYERFRENYWKSRATEYKIQNNK